MSDQHHIFSLKSQKVRNLLLAIVISIWQIEETNYRYRLKLDDFPTCAFRTITTTCYTVTKGITNPRRSKQKLHRRSVAAEMLAE